MKKTRIIIRRIGWFLLILGILSGSLHFVKLNKEKQDLNQLKQDFEAMLSDPVEPTDDEEPITDDNIWGMLSINEVGINLPIAISDNFDGLYTSLVAYASAPVPPKKGNFAIAGHNGSCAVCTFKYLHKAKEGQRVEITSKEGTFIYEIYSIRHNVMNTETSVLNPVPNETTLTLITCEVSSWTDPRRLIVQARLIETIPRT